MYDPDLRAREEAFKNTLLSWFTPGGFLRAGLSVALLIMGLGLAPNIQRILSSDVGRHEFAMELPWLILLSLAGGFGAILLGMLIAVIGGWLLTRGKKPPS
jgi:hypothetical protein